MQGNSHAFSFSAPLRAARAELAPVLQAPQKLVRIPSLPLPECPVQPSMNLCSGWLPLLMEESLQFTTGGQAVILPPQPVTDRQGQRVPLRPFARALPIATLMGQVLPSKQPLPPPVLSTPHGLLTKPSNATRMQGPDVGSIACSTLSGTSTRGSMLPPCCAPSAVSSVSGALCRAGKKALDEEEEEEVVASGSACSSQAGKKLAGGVNLLNAQDMPGKPESTAAERDKSSAEPGRSVAETAASLQGDKHTGSREPSTMLAATSSQRHLLSDHGRPEDVPASGAMPPSPPQAPLVPHASTPSHSSVMRFSTPSANLRAQLDALHVRTVADAKAVGLPKTGVPQGTCATDGAPRCAAPLPTCADLKLQLEQQAADMQRIMSSLSMQMQELLTYPRFEFLPVEAS
eukprot:jgi/Mesvir1/22886/Mv25835-RA.1